MKKIMTVPEIFKAHLKKTTEEYPDLSLYKAIKVTIDKSPALFSWGLAAQATGVKESYLRTLEKRTK
jgi:hypothetical protein